MSVILGCGIKGVNLNLGHALLLYSFIFLVFLFEKENDISTDIGALKFMLLLELMTKITNCIC